MSEYLASQHPPAPRRARIIRALFCGLAVAALWAVYMTTGMGTSGDSRWVVPGALSLLREDDLDLDEYEPALRASGYAAVASADGHYYSVFPYGTTLLAAPFVWAAQGILDAAVWCMPSLDAILRARVNLADAPLGVDAFYWRVEQAIASFFMALEVVLFYFLARKKLSARGAVLAALLLGFCTPAWSIGATALWQHGPSLLLLTLALYLLFDAGARTRTAGLAGAALAFAYVVRPTNAIPLALFTLYVLFRHRRTLPLFLLCGAAVLVPFVFYNLYLHGSLLPPYFQAGKLSFHPALGTNLAVHIVSPARGLFVYGPVFAFALLGMGLCLKRRGPQFPLECTLLAIVLLHWLAISAYPHGWKGVSYGPRLFADMIPFLVWFILPTFQAIASAAPFERWTLRILFVILAAASCWMQWRGASDMDTWNWYLTPKYIDQAPARLWDWNDPPFLR